MMDVDDVEWWVMMFDHDNDGELPWRCIVKIMIMDDDDDDGCGGW